MERSIFIERVERTADGSALEATGFVEMLGFEFRWEAERIEGESLWTARLLPDQFDEESAALADMFLDNPPLAEDIEREFRRIGGTVFEESSR